MFNQYWPRNGWGKGRGAETSGNEERSGIWRRVKPRKGIYGVIRSRIVGIICLLVPQDLEGLGSTSTPNLPFCQLAFLLT